MIRLIGNFLFNVCSDQVLTFPAYSYKRKVPYSTPLTSSILVMSQQQCEVNRYRLEYKCELEDWAIRCYFFRSRSIHQWQNNYCLVVGYIPLDTNQVKQLRDFFLRFKKSL